MGHLELVAGLDELLEAEHVPDVDPEKDRGWRRIGPAVALGLLLVVLPLEAPSVGHRQSRAHLAMEDGRLTDLLEKTGQAPSGLVALPRCRGCQGPGAKK